MMDVKTDYKVNNINFEIKKLEDYIISEKLFDEDSLAKIKNNFLLVIKNCNDNQDVAEKSLSIYYTFISSIVNSYKASLREIYDNINELTEKIREKEKEIKGKISMETLVKVKNDFYGKILTPHAEENTKSYMKRCQTMMDAYLRFISYF